MIALCTIAVLLASAPPVALVKRSTTKASDEAVKAVLREITLGLEREGFEVRAGPETCGEDAKCLAGVAQTSGSAAALGVTIVNGRRALTVDIEAIDRLQHRLAAQAFGVPFKGEPLPADATEFFHLLKRALTPLPEDAPKVVQLEPAPTPTPELIQTRPHRPLLKVAVVTTIASGAVGIGLLIAGLVAKNQLDRDLHKSPIPITRDQAYTRAGLANGLGAGSATALTLCGAAGVASTLLWLVPESASSDED